MSDSGTGEDYFAEVEKEGYSLEVRMASDRDQMFEFFWSMNIEEFETREKGYYSNSDYIVEADDGVFRLFSNGMPSDQITSYYLETTDLGEEKVIKEMLDDMEDQLAK